MYIYKSKYILVCLDVANPSIFGSCHYALLCHRYLAIRRDYGQATRFKKGPGEFGKDVMGTINWWWEVKLYRWVKNFKKLVHRKIRVLGGNKKKGISYFLISISLQPDVVYLRYFKLWILWNQKFQMSKS